MQWKQFFDFSYREKIALDMLEILRRDELNQDINISRKLLGRTDLQEVNLDVLNKLEKELEEFD